MTDVDPDDFFEQNTIEADVFWGVLKAGFVLLAAFCLVRLLL